MTGAEFVKRIERAVYIPAIEGTLSSLGSPPGRQPSSVLVQLSEWFNRLPLQDREYVGETVRLAVRHTVFGILTVLDGLRSVSELGETGSLELRYKTATESVLLNDPRGEPLHDLFAGNAPLP